MEQSTRDGGGGPCRIPSEKEVEVIDILLNLPKLISKYEFLSQYSFTWGSTKKRSFLPAPLNQLAVDEGFPVKVTAAEARKSPSTPLCFLPSVGEKLRRKEIQVDEGLPEKGPAAEATKSSSTPLCFLPPVRENLKRKATTLDLMETMRYNGMQQEREILVKEVKAMKTHHQELSAHNMESKGKRQEINYSRSIEDFQSLQLQLWNNCRQHSQQYMMMDNDVRARSAAADARKKRMLKLKQIKYNSMLSSKLLRG